MPFALLVYDHDDSLDALSDQERDAVYGEYLDFGRTDGVSGYRLAPPEAACTLRIERKQRHVRPGPFTDHRPALAGFYVIATEDRDEALELAARIPAARLGGTVAIHPLREA